MPQAARRLEIPKPPDPAAAKRRNSLLVNGFMMAPVQGSNVSVMINRFYHIDFSKKEGIVNFVSPLDLQSIEIEYLPSLK
jgi:hypothetical protein